MLPWLWFWTPQLHFPFSGDVAQRIEPDTSWFFEGIPPRAGDAEIEERAFEVASYGRQLGLLNEVVIDLAAQLGPRSPKATESLARLRAIQAEIERIKIDQRTGRLAEIETQVAELRRAGGLDYAELRRRLLPLLAPPEA